MSSKVMATTVMAPSSLPSKKRKASNGSHSLQEESASSTATANDNVRIRNESTSSEQTDNNINNNNNNNSSNYASKIADSRLPSKKRKGSHDSQQQQQQQQQQTTKRKGSHDQSVSFEDDLPRKSSVDSSTSAGGGGGGMPLLEALPMRKLSHGDDTANSSSSVKVTDDDLLLQPLDAAGRVLPGEPAPRTTTTTAAAAAVTSPTEATVYAPAEDIDAVAAAQPSALEHLDALADNDDPNDHNSSNNNDDDAKLAARRKTSDAEDSRSKSSDTTFASSGQRLLFEAIMISNLEDAAASQQGHQLGHFSRERLESWGGFRSSAIATRGGTADGDFHHSINNPTTAGGRLRLDSWGGLRGGRDRLESWGAMSDLSIPLGPSHVGDSASASVQQQQQQQQQHPLHHAHGGDEHAAARAAADGSASTEDSKPSAVPSRISLEVGRFNSIGNMSEVSASNLPLMLDGMDVTGDMQAYVAAAMATVGDQLAEIAGAVETVASTADSATLEAIRKEIGIDSDADSGLSPIIGAVSDAKGNKGRPRSWSTSSGKISVDYEAVQAAVDAAEAATGALGLAKIGQTAGSSAKSNAVSGTQVLRKRRSLPTKQSRARSYSSDEVGSGMSGEEKERIRERARAAAGYVPTCPGTSSDDLPSTKKRLPPIKKRAKRNSQESDRVNQNATDKFQTPKVSNTKDSRKSPPPAPDVAASSIAPSTQSSSKSRAQVNQKWEGMFECLLEFVEERRKEETEGMTEEEKKNWVWDGNVPTNYKTSCGKALGRWVNNQRSAKSKGTLKEDREERLVAAGLKWSVVASNSWNGMLEELRIYAKEQTRDGRKWDGNVPTCYQIKRDSGKFAGEDKNLGRWVNRQRSLYQAGKLRKERQLALEGVGLKWSMLATMSWESMYETLEAYVETQKKENGEWDGNVPANYRTNDNPPRALGRWINRQRSAYMKNKLKKEYVGKLNKIGLKWSVHQRQGDSEEAGQANDKLNGTSGETKRETKSENGEERDTV